MGEKLNENSENKRKWRKKRKNFVSNAKKYAKKGQLGRGTKMTEELYQYFVGILDAMKEGVEDNEERQALVNNVLERTKGEELNIIGNQLGCRVIEIILPDASAEDLERFINILSPEIRRLCSDNFSSHIVETLLRVSCNRAIGDISLDKNDSDDVEPENKKKKKEKQKKYTEEHIKKCYDFTLKICKYALNNLEDFVWDSYANHVLRMALKCLSGITLLPGEKPKVNFFKNVTQKSKGIPPHQTSIQYKEVPDEFKCIVKEFAERLSSWPQFQDLPYQDITSGLLQVLLYAVKNVDKALTKNLLKILLNNSFAPDDWMPSDNDEKKDKKKIKEDNGSDIEKELVEKVNNNLPRVFSSQCAVRLLEAALFVAKKKMYTQIYAKCFINRLSELSTMPMLNFTVQRLIDNCQIKEEFEPMFEELSTKFGSLLECGNTGVLVALAKACLRIGSKQMQYIKNLESTLKCDNSEHEKYFPVACLRLLPLDKMDLTTLGKEYFINIHGSVILQTILDFQRPTKAVNGLLEMSPEELMVILLDAKGCHVADAFCKGRVVGAKPREKLIHKLKGYFQTLALSLYGSRALEQLFEVAAPAQKLKIMAELADKSSLLNSTSYGRLIASKFDVTTFKLSQKKWEQSHIPRSDK